MYMYNKNGDKALITSEQIPALEAAGWTKEPPKEVKEVKEVVAKDDNNDNVDNNDNGADKTAHKKLTLKK